MIRYALLALPLLAGCATITIPSPASPIAPPPTWSGEVAHVEPVAPARAWWRGLDEPMLDRLVEDAVAANYDLRAADANLRAARALVREARTAYLPGGGFRAGVERRRDPAAPQVAQFPELGGGAFPTQTIATAGFETSWEIDLFGRLGAGAAAVRADALEALWQRRETEAAVVAATVRAWLDARHAARRAVLLTRRCQVLTDTAGIIAASVEAGAMRSTQRLSAEAAASECSGVVRVVEADRRNALRRLATLTGRPFNALHALPVDGAPITTPATLAAGDPSQSLRLRPDVGAAEARLQAMLARAGVERGWLYPRIELIGGASLTAPPVSFGQTASLGFAFGPRLSWDVFNLPRIRARIRAADATAEARLAAWHSTILKALEDADTALENWAAAGRTAAASLAVAHAAAAAERDVVVREKSGLASRLAAAQAHEAALAAQLDAEGHAHAARIGWAAAQLAIGCGWRA